MTVTDLLAQLRHANAALLLLYDQVDRSRAERDAVISEIARSVGIDPRFRVSVNCESWRDGGGDVLTYCCEANEWLSCSESILARTADAVVCAPYETIHGLSRCSMTSRVVRPLSALVK